MTSQTRNRILAWVVAVATSIPALGWAWSIVDNRYVKRDEFIVRTILDSINNVTTQRKLDDQGSKLDEILKRQEQIQCGPKIERGCR